MKKALIFFTSIIIVFMTLSVWNINVNASSDQPTPSTGPEQGGTYPYAIVGEKYQKYDQVKVNYDYRHNFIKISAAEVAFERKKTVDGFGTNDQYEDFAKHAYVCYKLENIISAPYQSEMIGYLYNGCERSVTHSGIESTTYESSLSNTISMMAGLKKNLGIVLDIFNIGTSSTTEIRDEVTLKISKSHTITNTTSETITYPIYENGYYYSQRRATFNMYVTVSFDKNYDVVKTYKWVGLYKNTYYQYNFTDYTVTEIKVSYVEISDLGKTMSIYSLLEDGTLVYSGPKQYENYIYY